MQTYQIAVIIMKHIMERRLEYEEEIGTILPGWKIQFDGDDLHVEATIAQPVEEMTLTLDIDL